MVEVIKKEMIKDIIHKRKRDSHKGDYGRVLVVSGWGGMPGAAALTALSSLRSGSGLVYISTTKTNRPVVQTIVQEGICIDWDDAIEHIYDNEGWKYDSIAFGPGMGTGLKAKNMLKTILLTYTGNLVLDADGLNLLSLDKGLMDMAQNFLGELIITPHMGEARRLLNFKKDENISRKDMLVSLVEKYKSISVLKGKDTLISGYSKENENKIDIWKNPIGNPGMATAGSGDVLTGIIASFIGQGISPLSAVKAAVYIHGLAGDMAAADKGQFGMIARDITEKIPYSIKSIIDI